MKKKYLYVTDEDLFDSSSLKNPVACLDGKLEKYYPEYFENNYDLRLLVKHEPVKAERESSIYNDVFEKIGSNDISVFKDSAVKNKAKKVLLNGFSQEHFDYIAPYIKDTTEVMYLFKCPRIKDLSVLAEFEKLKCLFIFWNNSLESLWDMKNNSDLEVLSFVNISKLRDISGLKNSTVKYITFDSTGVYPNPKELLIEDISAFDKLSGLKHLKLLYKKCKIDY